MKIPFCKNNDDTPLGLISREFANSKHQGRVYADKQYVIETKITAMKEIDRLIISFLHFQYQPGVVLTIDWQFLRNRIGTSLEVQDIISLRHDVTLWAEYVDANFNRYKSLGWRLSGPVIRDRLSDTYRHGLTDDIYLSLKEYKHEDTDEL